MVHVEAVRAPTRAGTALRASGPVRFATPYRAAAGLVVGTGVDLAVDPTHTHIPLCPFHAITGLWCPLCGGLRATYTLAHGDLAAAFRDNALFVAALPAILVAWVVWVTAARSGRREPRLSRTVSVTLLLLIVAFTIVRNLPFANVLRPQ